jgi:hypothetical protein
MILAWQKEGQLESDMFYEIEASMKAKQVICVMR